MRFTIDDLERLSKLARIQLTPGEKKIFTGQLSSIVDYVAQIGEVDVKGIRPTFAVPGLENVFREDVVRTDGGEKRLVEAAPKHERNLVKVKSVKEG